MKRFRLTHPRVKLVENDIEKQCLDYLPLRGYKVLRLHVGRFRAPDGTWITIGEAGLPDYVTLHQKYPGFLLETKRPKGKLNPKQIKLHWELTVAYKLAVATIDGFAALVQWLDEHERAALARWRSSEPTMQ